MYIIYKYHIYFFNDIFIYEKFNFVNLTLSGYQDPKSVLNRISLIHFLAFYI